MENSSIAILDLGTNTFHLLVVDPAKDTFEVIYREKIAVGLGRGGINEGYITAEAQKRALNAMIRFRRIIKKLKVEHIHATGTSALRCAKNSLEFIELVKEKTGIEIQIIDGDQEAEYIYHGVKTAVKMKFFPSLIIDIGGGSVEFIIADKEGIHWKQSFEIGGQRLLDRFHQIDPIPEEKIEELNDYLDHTLIDLKLACEKFKPVEIIGCSGTFDSLVEIYHETDEYEHAITGFRTERTLPLMSYLAIHKLLVGRNRDERLLVPGMVPLRADMIVVSSLLVKYILQEYHIKNIRVSSYALKEGLLTQILERFNKAIS
ncbi:MULTISPECIES: hypothetical protein [Persicobacter]|uniref:Ppx/GppA phosphatase N-terminal domain-containing protein n=1 Tax=Persicobacter diffluens TaxID=981 RepID=A0AAN4VYY6_9BACT|nr:hypothetical protein [Persicobacter sp. CCB-QB2]GJM62032.1 hypothetical protein PEDI_25840 [Persicobacter diffluens]